jgi:ATP-binding cassette subfamily B protein
VQRKLAAQPRRIGELAAAIAARVARLAAEREVEFRVDIVDADLLVTGETDEIERVVAMLCENEIEQAAPGERVGLRAQRMSSGEWLVVLGARDEPAALTDEQADEAERVLSAAGGMFMPAPVDGHVVYVAALQLVSVVSSVPPSVPLSAGAAAFSTVPADSAAMPGSARAPLLDGIAVLAIDDEEEARDALEAALVANGARVALAASGAEALERFERFAPAQWPDVVVCDIALGDEDGCDVHERIREVARRRAASAPPAIALTGHTDAATREHAERAGFEAHLVKPVQVDALTGEVRRLALYRRSSG